MSSTYGQGCAVTFIDCTYEVDVKNKKDKKKVTKTLIQNCSAVIPAGEVLALMGPSGAGKTTLLNMLTLEPSGGRAYGTILLNAVPFTLDEYSKRAANVAQTDQLWPFLTTREHIDYATALAQGNLSREQRRAFVDAMLEETGLTAVADVKAGNAFFKGLSGGQKRRLSLAVALCKRPNVIFLDEPTSGLDAASAAAIMQFLKETASKNHIAIICTIHQPSSSVFANFSSVAFLTAGEMAYVGKAADVAGYLEDVGYPLPKNTNPADYMLDLINKDFSPPETVQDMLAEWRARRPKVEVPPPTNLSTPVPAGFCSQLATLMSKHTTLVRRDPLQYALRVVMITFAMSFFAVMYIQQRSPDQDQVFNRFYFLFWMVGMPSSLGVTVVFANNLELQIVKREVKDGFYGGLPFTLVKTAIEVPFIALLSVCVIVPAAYPISNFEYSTMAHMYLVIMLVMWSIESIATCFSTGNNAMLGMLMFLNSFMGCLIFSGLPLQPSGVFWGFRWIAYVSPLRWGLNTMAYYAFIDMNLNGAYFCSALPANATPPVACQQGRSFYCTDTEGICYGPTGRQALQALNYQGFELLTPDYDWQVGGADVAQLICPRSELAVTCPRRARGWHEDSSSRCRRLLTLT